jgi:hypothetical protein
MIRQVSTEQHLYINPHLCASPERLPNQSCRIVSFWNGRVSGYHYVNLNVYQMKPPQGYLSRLEILALSLPELISQLECVGVMSS